jgi:hypothetical protein
MLTTAPMHLESVRRGGQPSTPIAALPEEASTAAALLEEASVPAALPEEARTAAALLLEARTAAAHRAEARMAVELLPEACTAAALRAEVHLMAARWRPSGCGRGLLSWRLRWPVTDDMAGSTGSAYLTGGATPSPQTGAKAFTGSRPSSGMVGGLPSPRLTMSSGLRS